MTRAPSVNQVQHADVTQWSGIPRASVFIHRYRPNLHLCVVHPMKGNRLFGGVNFGACTKSETVQCFCELTGRGRWGWTEISLHSAEVHGDNKHKLCLPRTGSRFVVGEGGLFFAEAKIQQRVLGGFWIHVFCTGSGIIPGVDRESAGPLLSRPPADFSPLTLRHRCRKVFLRHGKYFQLGSLGLACRNS